MSSHYAQGLEFLARLWEQVNDIKPDAVEHSVAVEQWNALEQTWKPLRTTFIATADVADEAMIASKRQRARHRIYIHKLIRADDLRTWHANACINHFKYVTYLSNHARTVRQQHASELVSLGNFQDHYEEALGSQTHTVRSHQIFLDTLGRNIEAWKLSHGLEIVCIRWNQLRAGANLKQAAKEFHLACKRLSIVKESADKAYRRATQVQKKEAQRTKEYELLEAKVIDVQRAIKALQKTLFGSTRRDAAVSASTPGEKAD